MEIKDENGNIVRSVRQIASDTKVRIVNETGDINDTQVFIDGKPMPNVLSIEINKIDVDTYCPFVTAKIEFLGVKLDMVTKHGQTR